MTSHYNKISYIIDLFPKTKGLPPIVTTLEDETMIGSELNVRRAVRRTRNKASRQSHLSTQMVSHQKYNFCYQGQRVLAFLLSALRTTIWW